MKSSINFFLYKIKKYFLAEKKSVNLTIIHIRLTLWRILKTIGFVVLLLVIEHLTTNYWLDNLNNIPDWLLKLQKLIPKPTYPEDRDAIIELISLIASVSGIILALFYPILATIASTAYAKVHASIRNLLLYEEETQAYLKRLTYLTASSIVVLFLLSFGYLPGSLLLTFLVFYSLITLFGILKIGLGVYNFFEPSTLAKIVFKKLTNFIDDITIEGEYWNEKKIQNLNYIHAKEQSENLSLLMNLCIKDNNLNESSFKSIFGIYMYSLQYYLLQKPKIPIDSLWFPNIYQHSSFFESDITQRQLSRDTNTFIQPKIKQNLYWFEERILNNLSNELKIVVEKGHVNILGESILMTYNIFDTLSKVADLNTGKILLNKLLINVRLIGNKKEKDSEINYENWKDELVCVDVFCNTVLRFQIGVFDSVSSFNSSKIVREYEKIKWGVTSSIYSTNFFPELYEQLNRFKLYIDNEKLIEGKQITPNWYLIQQLTSNHIKLATDKLFQSIHLFEIHLLSLAKHFENENNHLLSSLTAQIGLETIHKLRYRIDSLKKTFNNLNKLEVIKGEFAWNTPDFNEIKNKLSIYEENCITIVSKNIKEMALVKWNNQFPDIFAHSYAILSNKLNEYYEKNKIESFKKDFAPFLKSSLIGFNTIITTYKQHNNLHNISYQTLLDSMEISGYAYIYSVLYNSPEYWEEVKKSWDESFVPSKENIELLIKYYNYYKNTLHGTGINYTNKKTREKTLSIVIQELKTKEKDISDLLVKLFIDKEPYHHNFYDVAELFIELYLFTFIEAKDLTSKINRSIFNRLLMNFNKLNQNE